MNFKQKLTTSFAAGAIMLSTFAPAAFAATNVHVSGNGSRSNNDVSVTQEYRTTIDQRNNADFNNTVRVNSNTGNNRASGNTGGDVFLGTGDANTSVHISNRANMNHVRIGGSGSGGGNGNSNGDGMMHHNGWKLHTFMNGSQEVPGPGDPDGWGRAKVRVNPTAEQLCVDMWVKNIMPATAAHIHEAPAGVAGPVVVTLPTPNADGYASGCVSVDSNELMEIKNDPSDYYVNVHNAAYPNGAVRGQLSR
jgi:hypothetical protein